MPSLPDPIHDLRVLLLEPHLGYPRHNRSHPWHELVVVVRGIYRVKVGGREIRLEPGDAVLYPAGVVHRPAPADGRQLTVVCAMWADENAVDGGVLVAHAPLQRLAQAAMWLYDLALRPGASDRATDLLQALLAEVQYCAGDGDATAMDDPVSRLHALLAANLTVNQHLPNLAALVGMSPTHLSRLFKARFGTTPMRHLRRLRIEAALTMIRDERQGLDGIARACGLGRASYVSRVIRQETGRSPRELRRGSA